MVKTGKFNEIREEILPNRGEIIKKVSKNFGG